MSRPDTRTIESPWPESCPHCGAEYSEGIGVVRVKGTLAVTGDSWHGTHPSFMPIGLASIMQVDRSGLHPAVYKIRDLDTVVDWEPVGKCSECDQPVSSQQAIASESEARPSAGPKSISAAAGMLQGGVSDD